MIEKRLDNFIRNIKFLVYFKNEGVTYYNRNRGVVNIVFKNPPQGNIIITYE